MSKEHNQLQEEIQYALSRAGATVYKNTTTFGYAGKPVARDNAKRLITLQNFSPLQSGIPNKGGGSDIIGWRPVEITPEMTGRRVAIFLACEVKTPEDGLSTKQDNFLRQVQRSGGIGFVARTPEEAVEQLQNVEYIFL